VQPADTDLAKHLENWKKADQLYNGPERDRVNFPDPVQAERHPPVRMGIFPVSWFDAFYEKTGVTGPYVFGVGMLTFVLTTELWVIEHGFTEFLSFWIMVYILNKKLGPRIAQYLDTQTEEYAQKRWHIPLAESKKVATDAIAEAEKSIWRQDGKKYLFEAKQENIALQLEEEYRRRLSEAHKAVKRRLDYQVATENAVRRYQQQHMVNWITGNVVKNITPQQERESITKCIADLKALAAKP